MLRSRAVHTGPPSRARAAEAPPALRRLAPALATVLVTISGCGSAPPPTGDAQETAVAIPAGVEDCAAFDADGTTVGGEQGVPALQLPCLAGGEEITLDDLGDRPVLINLWASWCAPCREEMPMLQAAYERYGEAVRFLGVNTEDTLSAAVSVLDDLGVTYAHVVDRNRNLMTELAVPGLPVTLAVDADGRIVDRQVGQLSGARLDELVAGLAAGSLQGS